MLSKVIESVHQACTWSLKKQGTTAYAVVNACIANDSGQRFTRVSRPQTNAKAERVIRT